MIAKLVVWGNDRQHALLKLKNSLENYKILGLPTNIGFLRNILEVDEFKSGIYDTSFIEKNEGMLLKKQNEVDNEDLICAIIAKFSMIKNNIPNGL